MSLPKQRTTQLPQQRTAQPSITIAYLMAALLDRATLLHSKQNYGTQDQEHAEQGDNQACNAQCLVSIASAGVLLWRVTHLASHTGGGHARRSISTSRHAVVGIASLGRIVAATSMLCS